MPPLCYPRVCRVAALALFAGALGLVSARAADEDSNDGPARFHDVKAWRGSLVASARASPESLTLHENLWRQGGGKKAYWNFDYGAFVSVEFVLDDYESDPSVWRGRVTGSTYESGYRYFVHVPEIHANDPSWKGYSENEWIFNANGALDFRGDEKVELQFHRQRGWSVEMSSGRLGTEVRSHWFRYAPRKEEQDPEHDLIIAEDVSMRESTKAVASGMGGTGTLPYPKQGLILFASTQKMTASFPLNGSAGFSPAVDWDYTIYLEPASFDELRLEIDEPAAYKTWRPKTTPDAQAGPPLEVTARVVAKNGGPPRVAVKSFEWELEDTSREPGVTMNFPVNAADRRLDLELDAAGEFFVLENEKQRMVRAVRSGFSDTVQVVPYDWGGWCTLRVTAIMADGRRIVGKLKGKSETGLRVPKRAADSHIADAWKTETGARGADDADDENEPVGSGVKGDGLTLYQEYRGFYEAEQHISGDPKTKDFFVRLQDTPYAALGVEEFAYVTRLKVHYEFTEEQFPWSRIINANRSRGAHLVSQHGIVVRVNDALEDKFTTIGAPGNPGRIIAVELCPGADQADPVRVSAKIAHELGHCVNIAHHGEADYKYRKVEWFVRDGRLFETNPAIGPSVKEIWIVDESLTDRTPGMIAELRKDPGARSKYWIGQPQGQHSGFENCLMRYDCSLAYVLPYAVDNRVTHFFEPLGHLLCTSPVGTGVNKDGRPDPVSRYGDAAAGRGDCLHQLHVTDAVPAPNRTATSPAK